MAYRHGLRAKEACEGYAAAQRLIARVGPPISHWGMSRPLAPLSPGSGVFLFCVDQRMNGRTVTIALLVVGQAEGATLAA